MKRYIYEITNNVNGKTYIGQHTTDNENDGYMGSGVILKQEKQKYGINNFSKKILCYCDNQDELDDREIYYIAEYKKIGKAEYNIARGGRCVNADRAMADFMRTKEEFPFIQFENGRKFFIDEIMNENDFNFFLFNWLKSNPMTLVEEKNELDRSVNELISKQNIVYEILYELTNYQLKTINKSSRLLMYKIVAKMIKNQK